METRSEREHGSDHLRLTEKECITYFFTDSDVKYKIEYPFAYIRNISLEYGDVETGKQGGLVVQLHRQPNFYMEIYMREDWIQCADLQKTNRHL